jgi:vitamin K-dependent gamma-carboxylase
MGATHCENLWSAAKSRCVFVTSPELPAAQSFPATDARARPRLSEAFFAPVDIAPIIFFRITFGVLMFIEVLAYTFFGPVEQNWAGPNFHFTYFGFEWVKAPPGNWMYVLTGVMMLSALAIAAGFFYRVAAITFAIGFTWFYLIEQAQYMNHFYLICLLGFTAALLPAQRALSLDVRRRPALRADTAPVWTLWLLQAHMAIAYLFGGVAKINADWLRGEPIRTWLFTGNMGEKVPAAFKLEEVVYFLSYGGLLLDLLIAPFLIWRKTRAFAIAGAIIFHLLNAYLFKIGVFPFLSIVMTLLFLAPSRFRKILRLRHVAEPASNYWSRSPVIIALLAVYGAYHLFMPVRHWLYPGNVHWTEEGHRYAWHMMLRTKKGNAYFIVADRTTKELWRVHPRPYLSARQNNKMAVQPEQLLQFAHFLREKWSPRDVAVYAVSEVRLNDHKPALLVDPEVDLSRVKRSLKPATWILPFENSRSVPRRYHLAREAPTP